MPYKFKRAERVNSQVLLGLYSLSGAGKTYSALMIGRGLVGPKGKLALLDTESGRGALYADKIPGGYDYAEITAPFSPDKYQAAIQDAEAAGIECLIIDSMSHEWEGVGGVCDMAVATGNKGLAAWNKPKAAHLKMMLTLLNSRMHIICCLRGKRKTRQVEVTKNGRRETVIAKDDFATPKQDGDFIFEMLCHAEVMNSPEWIAAGKPKHSLRVTKISHPDLEPVFCTGAVATIAMGEQFAEWSKGGKPSPKSAAKIEPAKKSEQFTPATKPEESPPPNDDSADSDDDFQPEGGWPKFEKVSDWSKWSTDFLKTANREKAEAWLSWWRDYVTALADLVQQNRRGAADMDKALNVELKTAMKRN